MPKPTKYDAWFDTGKGRFALDQERRLLDAMLAGWPRRGRKMLDVGCGTGIFMEMLWHTGFDVTGVDQSPLVVKTARERFGGHAMQLHVANGECLPFENGEFDYVVLWSVLEFCADPEAVLAEAGRVAERGVLIGFLNKLSCYYVTHGMHFPWAPRGRLREARWFSSWELGALCRKTLGRRPSMSRSVLPGPLSTWRPSFPWNQLNGYNLPLVCGAFGAARVDFVAEKPLTPIVAWNREPEPS